MSDTDKTAADTGGPEFKKYLGNLLLKGNVFFMWQIVLILRSQFRHRLSSELLILFMKS